MDTHLPPDEPVISLAGPRTDLARMSGFAAAEMLALRQRRTMQRLVLDHLAARRRRAAAVAS